MNRLLEDPAVARYDALLGRAAVKRAAEAELDRVRAAGETPDLKAVVAALLVRLGELRNNDLVGVINATGIVTHTNLGRSPLAREALSAVERVARGYSNLEYDLAAGERGSRYDRVVGSICSLTGAEDALVTNNCAAGLLLILDTFAKGREAIVARGQLIEIGGGFRIPDVLARSGATLREVGTTNRTYAADFERAISPRTALLLRVHASNFRVEGFTAEPAGQELAQLGKRAGVTVVEDLGSGAIVDLAEYGLPHERTVGEALADGMELIAFSGDKLLGGPQAGIVAGRSHLISRLRSNPLLRALRVDKMTLAALAATLHLHRSPQTRKRIPLYRMLGTTLEELRDRAARYVAAVPSATIVESDAYVGGGALPQAKIQSLAIALERPHSDTQAAALRREDPPIVARIEDGRLLLDLRTIAPEEDHIVIASLMRLAPP